MERWLKKFGSASKVTGADEQGKEKKRNDSDTKTTNDSNRNISVTPSTSSVTSAFQSQLSGIPGEGMCTYKQCYFRFTQLLVVQK